MTFDKHDVVIQKVNEIKKRGGTAIKVELEANLRRDRDSDNCGNCDEGSVGCDYCTDGTVSCSTCEGQGGIDNPAFSSTSVDEDAVIECEVCNGTGSETCEECGGSGSETCDECGGDYEASDWSDESYCHDWIMGELADLGLAEHRTETLELSHGIRTNWHPVAPLTYAEFYNDGSVDSELTFTILIDNPENVYLIPKVMEAFNRLAEEIGQGMYLDKAGMHTAVLFDKDGLYPTEPTPAQNKRFKNFSKSMNLLLPAMFFLASGNDRSRSLEYRQPRVSCPTSDTSELRGVYGQFYRNTKYAAIAFREGALEYRLFNTCYDNPEAILDNIVVIANTLKYWRDTYRPSGLSGIAKEVKFGNDKNDRLSRLYVTTEHIDLLNAGLKKLKPDYYTIKELKEQRKFETDKRQIKSRVATAAKKAKEEYKSYKVKKEWDMRIYKARVHADLMENYVYKANATALLTANPEAVIADIEKEAMKYYEQRYIDRGKIMTAEEYVAEAIKNLPAADPGVFTLKEGVTRKKKKKPLTAQEYVDRVLNRTSTISWGQGVAGFTDLSGPF